jgi:protein-L-isoaspartate O-methyltransferase
MNTIHSIANNKEELKIFIDYLKQEKPSVLLEIGTFKGVSSAIASQYVDKVITIDKYNNLDKENKRSNVKYIIIESEQEKADLIEYIYFDMAFIDGMHRAPYPEKEFKMCKRCGKVLFHDYIDNKAFQGVTDIVNKLDCEIKKPFAFWRQKDD